MHVRPLPFPALVLAGSVAIAQSTTTVPDLDWVETRHVEFNGLDGAFDIVAAPNQIDLYVSGYLDDSVVHFLRNPQTGALTWVATYRDGEGGVTGLDGPEQLALSPDGTSLYAAVNLSDGLVSFARDPATGALTWQAYATTPGLDRAASVTVHPSGDRIYVASFGTGNLQVFQRTPPVAPVATYSITDPGLVGALSIVPVPAINGTLLYVAGSSADTLSVWLDTGTAIQPVQSFTDGLGGVDGLDGANDIELSADGQHLYVGSSEDGAVAHFTRDAAGLLTWVSAFRGFGGLSQVNRLELAQDDSRIYLSDGGTDRVRAFPVDPTTGEISYPGATRGGGLPPFAVQDIPYGLLLLGEHLYAAALGGDAVVGYVADEFPNAPPEQTEAYPRLALSSSVWDPIAAVFVPMVDRMRRIDSLIAPPIDPVFGFSRVIGAQGSPYGGVTSWLVNEETGATVPEWTITAPEAGAATVLATGDGEHLYVGRDEDSGTGGIEVWRLGYAGSDPVLVQSRPLARGSQAFDVRRMVLDSTETNLYVAAGNGAVQRYSRIPLTGEINFEEGYLPSGWSETIDLAITPAGDALYVTVRGTDGVVRWPLNADGSLTATPIYVGTAPTYQSPADVEVSADGSRLLVTTQSPFRLHNAPIQPGGTLGMAQSVVPGGQPQDLVLGSDNRVYVVSNSIDQLAQVYRLDAATGQLQALGQVGADVCAVSTNCASLPGAVAISSDGRHLFTSAQGSLFGAAQGGLFVHRDTTVIFRDGFESGGLWSWAGNTLPLR